MLQLYTAEKQCLGLRFQLKSEEQTQHIAFSKKVYHKRVDFYVAFCINIQIFPSFADKIRDFSSFSDTKISFPYIVA